MKRAVPLAAVAAWLAVCSPAPHAGAAPTTVVTAPAEGSVETISISTSDNLTLAGDFYTPRKKGRAPAALLVHDAGGDRTQLVPVAERLQRLGFAVLAIDLRGHGASVSDQYDWSKLDDQARERMWALTLRDLNAAAEYLRSRSDVHTSNLSLVGLRSGAAVAVKYAADDQNARAVVLLDPQPESYGFNLVRDVEKLEGLPTLIMAPSAARNVAERLARVGEEANGGHPFIEQGFVKGEGDELLSDKRLPREVADWLKDQVMPGKGDR
jgi:pimeloyl-ACP methyl ester carboxylesterase